MHLWAVIEQVRSSTSKPWSIKIDAVLGRGWSEGKWSSGDCAGISTSNIIRRNSAWREWIWMKWICRRRFERHVRLVLATGAGRLAVVRIGMGMVDMVRVWNNEETEKRNDVWFKYRLVQQTTVFWPCSACSIFSFSHTQNIGSNSLCEIWS